MFCRNSNNNGGVGMHGNGMQHQQEMNNTTTTNFADSINRWLVQVRNQQQPPITMPNNAMANNNSNNNQQQQRERTVSISCSSIGTNTSSFDVISGGGGGHNTSISMFPTLAPQCGYGIFYPVASPNNPFIAHFEELNRLPLDYWLLKKNGAGAGGNGGNATAAPQPPKNASSCVATLSVANPVAAFSSPYPQHAKSSTATASPDQLAAMLSQVSTLRSGIEQVEQQLKRMVLEKGGDNGMEVEEENGRNEEEESRRTTHTYSIGSGAGDAATMEADDGEGDDDDKTEREMEGKVKQENDEHPGFCFNTVISTPAPYKFTSLEDFLPKKPANAPLKLPADPTYWLKKYPPPKPNRPMNEMAEDLSCWQSVLGWKSILEKIHASGEDVWLAPSSRAIKN